MIYNVESFLDARAKDLIKSKRIYLADLLSLAKLGSEVFKNPDKTKDLLNDLNLLNSQEYDKGVHALYSAAAVCYELSKADFKILVSREEVRVKNPNRTRYELKAQKCIELAEKLSEEKIDRLNRIMDEADKK